MANDQTLLLINTSGDEALVVLSRGEGIVFERRWKNGPDAGRKALRAIDELLKEKAIELRNLERIAVQTGPSRRYSSLRSGVVVASMLAYTAGVKLVQVSGKNSGDVIRQAWENEVVDVVVPLYEYL